MSIHSITCNNDNQDIVSMGTNSALITKKVIDNAFQVVSIQIIACVKALEILKVEDNVSGETNKIMKEIKKLIGIHNKEDNIFYDKLELVENFIKDNKNE